jgi:hypothetical protein
MTVTVTGYKVYYIDVGNIKGAIKNGQSRDKADRIRVKAKNMSLAILLTFPKNLYKLFEHF